MNYLQLPQHNELGHDYSSGIQSCTENNDLTKDISHISSKNNLFMQIKELKLLHSKYTSTLSNSHINYYINKTKNEIKSKILMTLFILLFIFYLVFTIVRINTAYQRFSNMDISENTFQRAVDYYNAGDYTAALLRFELLYNNGWDNANTVYYMHFIYLEQNNYDAAAELLLQYLEHNYGYANISNENSFLIGLQELYNLTPLSSRVHSNVEKALNIIDSYLETYSNLYYNIHTGNYQEALYLCKNLEAAGANGFYFVSCYSNVLINLDRIEDAYTLIMDTVQEDVTLNIRMINIRQRKTLINYIIPYLNDEQISTCRAFLANDLDSLNILNDSEIVEPYISYEKASWAFSSDFSIHNLNYINELDEISVAPDTTMFNGSECYYIKVTHYDGDYIDQKYFLMDMNYNIYIFINGKYLQLPIEGDSDPPEYEEDPEPCYYINSSNPDITLCIDYDINNNFSYTFSNTSTKEIILKNHPVDYSNLGLYAYAEENDTEFTLFFSSDIVVIFNKKSENGSSFLEGRYVAI